MKQICYALIVATSLFYVGCEKKVPTLEERMEQEGKDVSQPPSEAVYRKLLEKRIASGGGAAININLEVSKYRKATPDEKREMYKKVEALVK